jgi:ribonucleoside-diphosphate reductase alpha chain
MFVILSAPFTQFGFIGMKIFNALCVSGCIWLLFELSSYFGVKRKWRGGEEIMYHPLFEEWVVTHKDEDKAPYFVSANDLTPLEHVRVQAVAQEFIDSSISKTVNAPNAHTIEDVKNLYMMAYDMNLKGVTYMRDGSRAGVLERIEEKKEEKPKEEVVTIPATPRIQRPVMLTGTTYKADTPSGKMYVTVNHDHMNQPFEVFINNGKSGSDVMAMADALGRMISFVLRIHSPVPQRDRMREIVSELTGIGGARSVGFGENKVRSLPDAVAKLLARHYDFRVNGVVQDKVTLPEPEEQPATESVNLTNGNGHAGAGQMQMLSLHVDAQVASPAAPSTSLFDICPECGSATLAYEEGCQKCYSCGHSEC